jgi:7-carboxy-7-deazaguanine synthase
MFGKNKILKIEQHAGDFLDVQEIFPTLQGEGPFVGQGAIFIRLGGCNLKCNFCDTEFDSFKNFSLIEILQKVVELAKNSQQKIVRKLVVITGGEPMRQPIEKLCKELISLNFLVQIETNGTIFRELPRQVKIICSPKISNHKYHFLRPDILPKIDALKFIISASNEDYFMVGEVGQSSRQDITIYVQPMDEYDEKKNKENLQKCLNLCEENGYFLSLQTHKIIGLK